ncbi:MULTISPECIES: DUF4135 domain-containing protein [Legionella]|uniref:DUF4135 domain-containing protein n=1 Tax=Legionella septentrionalis TaxID=2498109 RepID=A0A3S0V9Y8_9GAMM|nr:MULTISPECIES: DUF4135 domain-containing protein [Legionella]MCP0914707.1 DUF4135 domain-containing protein [Legionella sp. 27cVA30]RUQ84486.1 DUF4135 domain-containing protein [Legionella septentrionalis]RUQ93674.1 DUF4135 domain-containing protein [Legionella septentrionalis]RUR12926.1 DUF4135 domain-containing protein [Legionella septentrionalis]
MEIYDFLSIACTFQHSKHAELAANYFVDYLNYINTDILEFCFFLKQNNKSELNYIGNFLSQIFEYYSGFVEQLLSVTYIDSLTRVGDVHNQGKSTTLVISGKEKFILKPVSTEMLSILNGIYIFLNNYENFCFETLDITILNSNLSKIAYVENANCENNQKYAYHWGALLFILTCIRGIDFHSENILCSSSIPVIVDCESLFYPIIFNIKPYDYTATSLLINNTIHFVSYKEEIKSGIEGAYRAVNEAPLFFIELIKKNYQKRKRMIFKPTRYYFTLLKNSTHPKFLLDKEKRKTYLHESLTGSHFISKTIIDSEVNELMQFDIPYFFHENNYLYNSKGILIEQNIIKNSDEVMLEDVKNLFNFKHNLLTKLGL